MSEREKDDGPIVLTVREVTAPDDEAAQRGHEAGRRWALAAPPTWDSPRAPRGPSWRQLMDVMFTPKDRLPAADFVRCMRKTVFRPADLAFHFERTRYADSEIYLRGFVEGVRATIGAANIHKH